MATATLSELGVDITVTNSFEVPLLDGQAYMNYIAPCDRANYQLLLSPEESAMDDVKHPLGYAKGLLFVCVCEENLDLALLVDAIESRMGPVDPQDYDLFVHAYYADDDGNKVNQFSMPDLELRQKLDDYLVYRLYNQPTVYSI